VRLKWVLCLDQVLESSDSSSDASSSSSGESPNVVFVSLLENLLTSGPVSSENDSHVSAGEVIFTTECNNE